MVEQSYSSRGAGSAISSGGEGEPTKEEYWPLTKLRRCYNDYYFSKSEERKEAQQARRYYHGSQYTEEQVASLRKRKQPIMTFNRIGRKIDGVIGLVEKLRQDPKAYPRTPQHEEGAELATAALRYVLDEQEWKAKSPIVAFNGAVDGIGGIELVLEKGDQGDPEVGFDEIDIPNFFYDPYSAKPDFSDAGFMGIGKWYSLDKAQRMFPDADENAFFGNADVIVDNDREMRWFSSESGRRRARLIEIWYEHNDGWCFAVFTGTKVLQEGHSPFTNEKGKQFCKYQMFSGNVDQSGDRYGFVRNMQSAQDGINAKQSKMQHIIASKRLILSQGAVDDIEKTRTEWARPDGVILTNRPVNEGVKIDDQSFDFAGLAKLLELNLTEIENFGPNPALLGTGVENKSGRAIALLQQAGMAELGPYILAYRGWKIRVYRAIWNLVKQHWQAERWIRVTDDEGLAQFVQVNKMQTDPMSQQTQIVNAIGSLDVDIILDEAPDAITIQTQSFEVLQALGPQFVMQFPEIAVELSPLDAATKKKIREKSQQGQQAQQPMKQLEMAAGGAKVELDQASKRLKDAQAQKAMIDARLRPIEVQQAGQADPMQPMEPQPYEVPAHLQDAQAMADIRDTHAAAEQKLAAANKARTDASLAPAQAAHDMREDAMARQERVAFKGADIRGSVEDRKIAAKTAANKTKSNGRPAAR